MTKTIEVWPGPMEGIARPEFIKAVTALQLVPRWMTAFLRVSETCYKEKKIREFLAPYLESGLPITAQIMGADPDLLAELAAKCLACGAADINLNCGCPSKRVISGGAGGGMLKTPQKMIEAAYCIRQALGKSVPFSIKMRSGFSDPEEMYSLIPELAAAGVDKFFIHYRTVKEQYLAVPGRTERLKRAVAASPCPVVINGDIDSVQDGMHLLEETRAAGIMIARAFLHDPWLLKRFCSPDSPDPETGRKLFFETLESFNITGGCRLELAKMIWGANSETFRNMLPGNQNKKS